MIIGVGIDVVSIDRFQAKKSDEFIKKLLTEHEQNKYKTVIGESNQNIFLAIRWSLKEAIFKALKTWDEFTQLEIRKIHGAYECSLNEKIKLHLSISHEGQRLVAMAVAERI
ncbi:Holo-[acyl-carrier-protein] synthase [Mycoplasmoides gallisepticum CA06_2006.052-5-2P]|uniref:Holo-[acyl-carrier-protein] synthase n=4 Tax=Mycoplasmoides gallisepticum TaxID=2096 RepID=ACPS_MYCGA|nr:holo-ACP synthase [Mycoplasmoides gallisepticum]Q7NB74.2 RecName: Full=Holo-[acyl-carrier-protein] synthase; Short=Holo-ACP synthase; AltName: Full=4'-phosphopantetheinyl transferase AcpS [Mycoplasmoides gallisepticum str. R(low)]AAP56755.2 Holo-[acyl-carrier-protein] synthase [Mycoplasmoides gallisepticum str. R(low)]ADC30608.1 Holo-[acyl-carrier-protein] synthase [Mycoplasmoides gallisepticum str. R(high)]ADC31357.1 Holo-[acyl-carrier-protein] synthase [Mycoplasmoides gallisepticum str. F]